MDRCEVSVIVPVYGCAGCLVALHARLAAVLGTADWELVLVDDCSPDGSWSILEELSENDERVRALRLSRNFGQHAAITAGLAEARGNWVVVMDCDLQDPPEEIPRLLQAAREGYEVVLTKRDRRRHSLYRRLAAGGYYRARNLLLGQSMSSDYSTLSVVSRNVVDAFLTLGDRDRQYLLILHWLGFRRTVLPLRHADRYEGRSSYTLGKLIEVAVDGMFFQTTRLLRWIVIFGFFVAACGLGLAIVFIAYYFTAHALPGFTALAVLILFVGGFIIVSTGIIGLYVGKIFDQVKGRPLYVVERRTGGPGSVRTPGIIRDKSAAPS
jgi:glycosyltransferase involved in cell wall biosynthesis